MEKKLITDTYAVSSEIDGYAIFANVRINSSNEVESMESGQVHKSGAFLASFGLYGENSNVNYNALTLDEKNTVNAVIEDFKASITNN